MSRQELRRLYEEGLYGDIELKVKMYLRGLEMLVNDNESFEKWNKLKNIADSFLEQLYAEIHKDEEVITMEDE